MLPLYISATVGRHIHTILYFYIILDGYQHNSLQDGLRNQQKKAQAALMFVAVYACLFMCFLRVLYACMLLKKLSHWEAYFYHYHYSIYVLKSVSFIIIMITLCAACSICTLR